VVLERDWLSLEARRIALDNDYLTHEMLLEESRPDVAVEYIKRDFVFRPGLWRGTSQEPVWRRRIKKGSLVIGHSDLRTTCRDVLMIKILTGARVYCANLSCPDWFLKLSQSHKLPLGLTNPTNESEFHAVFGDSSQISTVARELVGSNPLTLYANFDQRTSPKKRAFLAELCGSMPHIRVGTMDPTRTGRLRYLRDMRDTRLVICPEGNGMDTHRFWEALYVGAIPVVLKNSYSAKLGSLLNLPYLPIESWGELASESHVVARGQEILASRSFGLDAARGSHWKHLIFGSSTSGKLEKEW